MRYKSVVEVWRFVSNNTQKLVLNSCSMQH